MDRKTAGIALIATLDSKGAEASYLKEKLEALGRSVLILDVGTSGVPKCLADIPRERVAAQAPGYSECEDQGAMLRAMAKGAGRILADLASNAKITAIGGIGGGKGAGVFHQASCGLPFGFPKVLISSARPALLAEIATTSDTILMPTLVDLFGVNRLTRTILDNAVAVLSELKWNPPAQRQGKTVAITAFGVTTPAVEAIKADLELAGIEVIVFPANGAGGRTMEALIAKRQFEGVVDLTTTEMVDLRLGGTASAGSARLTAAGKAGIPQLIAPGAVDMANFGPPETVPERFGDRTTYRHTPMTTLVRTTAEDMVEIARMTADRLNDAKSPVAVVWPRHGVSDYDRSGHPFHDPAANIAWRQAIGQYLRSDIPIMDTDCHINDREFASLCAEWMIEQLNENECETLPGMKSSLA
ncbi:MAG: Tm-1-like ATP-binding domain-containing protein [Paracoccaceae bacterium]|nr:Tm-1-like ATP-binding domain-containing protein [Paracoccaceae bacterium]